MKRYQLIDQFIEDSELEIDDIFDSSTVQRWFDRHGVETAVGDALAAHRRSTERKYTTERIGMGPFSYYRVVDDGLLADSDAASRMITQMAMETVDRWINELDNRIKRVIVTPEGELARSRAENGILLMANQLDMDLKAISQEMES